MKRKHAKFLQSIGEALLYGGGLSTVEELARGSDKWGMVLIAISIAGYFLATHYKKGSK